MNMQIRPAARRKARLRLALDGPSKSGKTLTALRLAMMLGSRPVVIEAGEDTADLYEGLEFDGVKLSYEVGQLARTGPDDYTAAIAQAGKAGNDVLVIDGISPAWAGPGGMLELHDQIGGKNSWADWLKVNPMHARMIAAIKSYPGHVIVTMRSVTEWVTDKNAKGQDVPRKIGLKPQQRPMVEYEFDILGSLDVDHVLTITGSRCPGFDGAVASKPGRAFWLPLMGWLETGAAVAPVDRIPMISDTQAAEIVRVSSLLGEDARVESAALSRMFGATSFGVLTEAQAEQWLARLRDELARAEVRRATDRTRPAANGSPSPAPAGSAPATLQEGLAAMPGVTAGGGAPVQSAVVDPVERMYAARDSYYGLTGLGDVENAEVKAKRLYLWNATLQRRGFGPLTPPTAAVVRELTEIFETKVTELVERARNNGVTCGVKGAPSETAGAKS
jgi:hypothetical protein